MRENLIGSPVKDTVGELGSIDLREEKGMEWTEIKSPIISALGGVPMCLIFPKWPLEFANKINFGLAWA